MDVKMTRRMVVGAIAASAALPTIALGATRTLRLRTAAGRAIAVTHWRPKGLRRGTILFSHGAASAPWKYARLIESWAAKGWEIFAPLHVDSTDHPDSQAFPGLMSWAARIEDMHLLSEHLGKGDYVAAGHSYGGLVALTLGGAAAVAPPDLRKPLADPRARCVLAFSPPPPLPGLITAEGYAALSVPALIQTGTKDMWPAAPPGPDAWQGHLAAFDAARAGGNRYALVLEGVDHYFGGAICRPELPGPPQLIQLADAIYLSLLFGDAYYRRDKVARNRLDAALADSGPIIFQRK